MRQPENTRPQSPAIEPIERAALELPTRFAAPESRIEIAVARIWRETFNIDTVGLNDDFFDLGGDSLVATLISAAISAEMNYKFQPSILMTRSTVASVASLLEREIGDTMRDPRPDTGGKTEDPAHLVAVRAEGDLPPLFFIHGRLGISFPGRDFLAGLDPRHPVYFIQALGYFDDVRPPRSVTEIAEIYLATMRGKQPAGPLNIVSFCAGGIIAAEIAAMLGDKGDLPASLVLIDPPPRKLILGNAPGRWELRRKQLRRWRKLFLLKARMRIAGGWSKGAVNLTDGQMPVNYQKFLTLMAENDIDIEVPMPGMAYKAFNALRDAYFLWKPRLYAGPVDIISSRKKVSGLRPQDHKWFGIMPNLRLHIGAETHSELFRKEAGSVARKVQECVQAGQSRGTEA
jgi:pimeloyl-ACP methyl ester carboxylesterase